MKKKLVSFDVFDTLIARKCGAPQNIFDYVEKKILESHDREIVGEKDILSRFMYYRKVSEQRAFEDSQAHKKESSLEDIYNEFRFITGVNADTADILKQMELSAEIENCYGIKNTIDLLKNYLNENYRVVLISDMYLSSEQIYKVLEGIDPIFSELKIYVSSEQNATKASGELFSVVADKENADYFNWIHYGDNEFSDFTVPQNLGITTAKVCNRYYFVKTISDIICQSSSEFQYLLGISKKLSQDENLMPPTKIGLYFGGPICFGYVNWIIAIALKRNLNHLYFIARDGYVLKKVADEIIKNNELDIRTSYIYGSRIAWRNEDNANIIDMYIEQNIDLSDNRFALVDTQGTGKSVSKFAEKIFSRTGEKTKCFLFDKIDDYQSEYCRFYSMCSVTDSRLIEHLCRAPHSITSGYVNEKGKVIPVFTEQQKWESAEYEKINDYAKGVIEFIDELTKNISFIYDYEKIANIAIEYMRALNKSDERELVDFFGDIHLSNCMNDTDMLYAPKLTNEEVEIYLQKGLNIPESYYGACFDYSLRRCSVSQKVLIQVYMENIKESIKKHFIDASQKKGKLYPGKPNVVVYGAGKNGIKVCGMIVKSRCYNIVAWADINYKTKELYHVCSINEALEKDYDYIVISIKNEYASESARDVLISCGADEKKIVTADIFMRQFYAK